MYWVCGPARQASSIWDESPVNTCLEILCSAMRWRKQVQLQDEDWESFWSLDVVRAKSECVAKANVQ